MLKFLYKIRELSAIMDFASPDGYFLMVKLVLLKFWAAILDRLSRKWTTHSSQNLRKNIKMQGSFSPTSNLRTFQILPYSLLKIREKFWTFRIEHNNPDSILLNFFVNEVGENA